MALAKHYENPQINFSEIDFIQRRQINGIGVLYVNQENCIKQTDFNSIQRPFRMEPDFIKHEFRFHKRNYSRVQTVLELE